MSSQLQTDRICLFKPDGLYELRHEVCTSGTLNEGTNLYNLA
jgi:hypothetical protein